MTTTRGRADEKAVGFAGVPVVILIKKPLKLPICLLRDCYLAEKRPNEL
jgi:hypothetical protein